MGMNDGQCSPGDEDLRANELRLGFKGAVKMLEEQARDYISSHPSRRADLLQRHEELCNYARKIMEKKNQDYGADSDPFRNFREFGTYGILVRLSDKLARIRTWEERGQFAVDETLQETVLDAINYLILYLAMKERE